MNTLIRPGDAAKQKMRIRAGDVHKALIFAKSGQHWCAKL